MYNQLIVLVQGMLWGCLTYVPVHNYTSSCNWNCILWNQTKLKHCKLIKLAVMFNLVLLFLQQGSELTCVNQSFT